MTSVIVSDVRTSAPPLQATFRSRLQGELLAQVYLTPDRSITDLARALGSPVPTVQREVSRLASAGLLVTRTVGRSRLVSADRQNPATDAMQALVMIAFGPRWVVADELTDVVGDAEVYIFGSWAARYAGEAGPPPGDIDVLVVGSPDPDDLFEACERAAARLRREVNVTTVSDARWTAAAEPFVQTLRDRPLVQVLGRQAAR